MSPNDKQRETPRTDDALREGVGSSYNAVIMRCERMIALARQLECELAEALQREKGNAELYQHERIAPSSTREQKNTPIETLLKSYEDEGCDHSKLDWVAMAAMRYVDSMEDCQARCLLYVLAKAVLTPSATRNNDMRRVLEQALEKLRLYRAHQSGEYVGGMEYTALVDAIEKALATDSRRTE